MEKKFPQFIELKEQELAQIKGGTDPNNSNEDPPEEGGGG